MMIDKPEEYRGMRLATPDTGMRKHPDKIFLLPPDGCCYSATGGFSTNEQASSPPAGAPVISSECLCIAKSILL